MQPIRITLTTLKKQEKEFKCFRDDVNKHKAEFYSYLKIGYYFQAVCNTDKEIIKGEMVLMKQRWNNLNQNCADRMGLLEDTTIMTTESGSKDLNTNTDSEQSVTEVNSVSETVTTDEESVETVTIIDSATEEGSGSIDIGEAEKTISKKALETEARDLGRGLGGVQKGGGDMLIDAIGADGRPIGEHEKLNDDIIIVGDEDAQALSDRVERLTNCYASLVTDFHQSHNHISDWMNGVGGIIQSLDTYSLEEQEEEIHRLEGDGARAVERLVTRDN